MFAVCFTAGEKTTTSKTVLRDLKKHIEKDYTDNKNGRSGDLKQCCGYNDTLVRNVNFETKVSYVKHCKHLRTITYNIFLAPVAPILTIY